LLLNTEYNIKVGKYIKHHLYNKISVKKILYETIPTIDSENNLTQIYNKRNNYKKKKKHKNIELIFYSYISLIYNSESFKKIAINYDNIFLNNIIISMVYETITKKEMLNYEELINILYNYLNKEGK